jgi:hypothetical protein
MSPAHLQESISLSSAENVESHDLNYVSYTPSGVDLSLEGLTRAQRMVSVEFGSGCVPGYRSGTLRGRERCGRMEQEKEGSKNSLRSLSNTRMTRR